jgi:hypothetical protein
MRALLSATVHGRLYAGVLRAHLCADIPFVPHITVGAAPDSQSAEKLADRLRVSYRIVRGTVRSMELVDVGEPRVQSVTTSVFGKAEETSG